MQWKRWLADRLFGEVIAQRVQEAVRPDEDAGWRDLTHPGISRPWPELRDTIERVDRACRSNPLAARLVAMTLSLIHI